MKFGALHTVFVYKRKASNYIFYTFIFLHDLIYSPHVEKNHMLLVIKLDGEGPVDNGPSNKASPLCQKKKKSVTFDT